MNAVHAYKAAVERANQAQPRWRGASHSAEVTAAGDIALRGDVTYALLNLRDARAFAQWVLDITKEDPTP